MRLTPSHHALGRNSIDLVCVAQDGVRRPPLFARKGGGLKAAEAQNKRAGESRLALFAPRMGAYWPRPPEMLQNTFLTWLPSTIRTTMTTTAIKTRMRAYSTIPCPSSRLSSARRRRYRLVNMLDSPPFGSTFRMDPVSHRVAFIATRVPRRHDERFLTSP